MSDRAWPRFDVEVPQDGYHWWYLDALSDDGRSGLVIIAFVGSVFSPYYHRARARRQGDPQSYCAVNVGLYETGGKRWAMTERRAGSVTRDRDRFHVGPSAVGWRDGALEFDIDERCAPFGQRLAGRVRAEPVALCDHRCTLDGAGRHHWWPWAPVARVEVNFDRPACAWTGEAYLDMNWGDEPLEAGFHQWDWSRRHANGGVSIQYDALRSDGSRKAFGLFVAEDGAWRECPPEALRPLRPGGWGVARRPRCDDPVRLERTLEDTPFYTRSLLAVGGRAGGGKLVHESLSLERFRRAWVRTLLPFRMPREWRAQEPRRRDFAAAEEP